MEPYRFGLTGALAAIADGRFTMIEYLDSCIARTLAVEPAVRAFAHFDADAVRASASSAAASSKSSRGPLAGMPIGIKDIIATRAMPTEMGSAAFRGHVPDHSASVIDALEAASAIVFGKTVTTEFAWRQAGKTRNPWNIEHTPGGSSSGSAAAVACGCVPGALGTQTLGSVLRPAAFCGVVGFKPSYGAIPRTGVYAVSSSLDHIGVFARSVVDAALLASTLVRSDGIDLAHRSALAPAWPLRISTTAPRIALLRLAVEERMSAEQRALVEATTDRLRAQGARVETLELPASFDDLWRIAQTICDVEGAAVNAALAAESPPRISAPSLELVARGARVSALDYVRARETQAALIRTFAALMAPFDAALTAPAIGEAPTGLVDTGDAVFCTPGSLLGAPAIAIPAGVGSGGLPLGIQLLGRWGDDRRLLEAASWVERTIGWVQPLAPA